MIKLEVKIKNVYGTELVYPLGLDGKHVLALTGTKTLTPEHLRALRALGFQFKLVTNALGGLLETIES